VLFLTSAGLARLPGAWTGAGETHLNGACLRSVVPSSEGGAQSVLLLRLQAIPGVRGSRVAGCEIRIRGSRGSMGRWEGRHDGFHHQPDIRAYPRGYASSVRFPPTIRARGGPYISAAMVSPFNVFSGARVQPILTTGLAAPRERDRAGSDGCLWDNHSGNPAEGAHRRHSKPEGTICHGPASLAHPYLYA
jgi:hypothetical protein